MAMSVVEGSDLSVIQGVPPFEKLAELGHAFAICRCKVGNNPGIDIRFVENVRRGRGAGLAMMPYGFPFPLPHLSPLEQAKWFVEGAVVDGDPVGSKKGDGPPAFDLEWPPPEQWAARGCSADQIVDWALACLEQMTVAYGGIAPTIYSYPYFIAALSKAKNFAQLMKYRLWIAGGANYQNGNGAVPRRGDDGVWIDKPPSVPGWADNWLFWQYDGNGGRRLPNGVDADFDVFRGTLEEFHALIQLEEAPAIEAWAPDPATIAAMAANVMAEDELHAYRQDRLAQIFADAA
jgi:GH25 family lysozyme M1 (1,4-beta-N-acetylmuramidase)